MIELLVAYLLGVVTLPAAIVLAAGLGALARRRGDRRATRPPRGRGTRRRSHPRRQP